jgi:hypothetical protein
MIEASGGEVRISFPTAMRAYCFISEARAFVQPTFRQRFLARARLEGGRQQAATSHAAMVSVERRTHEEISVGCGDPTPVIEDLRKRCRDCR